MRQRMQRYFDRRRVIKSVGSFDEDGLLHAVCRGETESLRLLLDEGLSPDAKDHDGRPAIYLAVLHKQLLALQILLERPLEVNATDPHGRSALHLALLNEDKHSLLHLLGAGADPNLVSKDGQTPLMLAADKASGIFVRELLDAGAEINASDHQGRTALMIAADHQRTTCIKVLLEGGADPMLRDVEGHRAIDREGLPPRAEELLREASQQQRKSQLPPINDKLAALMGGMLEGSLKLLNESDSITELEQKGVDLIGQLTSDEQMAAWLGKLEETAIQSEIKFWLDLLVEIREILRLQQQQLRQQDLSETDAPRNWQKQVLWLAQQYREQLEDGLVITPSENV